MSNVKKKDFPISPVCPAPNHHSRRAGEGRINRTGPIDPDRKCICPRTLQLMRLENERHRLRAAARKAALPASLGPLPKQGNDHVPWPDLSSGYCRSPEGFEIFDQFADKPGRAVPRDRARQACLEYCSVLKQCRTWVLRAERPAGAWGGMIAGLTPGDRRDASILRDRAVG